MLADLLSECYAADFKECWERERTATSVKAFAVRRHATGCSLRETEVILRSIGVERTHQADWQWYIGSLTAFLTRSRSRERSSREPTSTLCVLVTVKPMRAQSTRPLSASTASCLGDTLQQTSTQNYCLASISSNGEEPIQQLSFFQQLAGKHDLSDAEFLVDGYGYLTALFRVGLSDHLDYIDRKLIEKWFQTLKMRTDRFDHSWVGSRPATAQ